MLLRDYSRDYLSVRDVTRDRAKQINWTIDRFERFLSRPPLLSDLIDATVNGWIDAMLESGLARRTVKSQRGNLLSLWRAAHFDGLVPAGPVRVKKIACPQLMPSAEPIENVAALLPAAKKLKGRFQRSQVGRPEFWTALIIFLWESGLRIGDALRVERDHISGGVLVLSQSKTGWPIVRPLSADCLRAIEATNPSGRRRVFGDALSRGRVFKGFKKLATAAGFNGGTKKIRKSGATAVEAACPGAAMGYLGHKTPGLAYKHYVDPRLVQQQSLSPPPLKDSPQTDGPEAA